MNEWSAMKRARRQCQNKHLLSATLFERLKMGGWGRKTPLFCKGNAGGPFADGGGGFRDFSAALCPFSFEVARSPAKCLTGPKNEIRRDASFYMKRPAEVFENILHRLINTRFDADIHKPHQFLFYDALIAFLLFLFVGAIYSHCFFTSLVMWML